MSKQQPGLLGKGKRRAVRGRARGFSLVEVLVGLFLVAVSVLGLAQLFLIAISNNLKADRVANGTYLAQQQIDWLRGFTLDELKAYALTTLNARDETIDLNRDGTNDFRRITDVRDVQDMFQVRVYVYSAEKIPSAENMSFADPAALLALANTVQHRPQALISTIITR